MSLHAGYASVKHLLESHFGVENRLRIGGKNKSVELNVSRVKSTPIGDGMQSFLHISAFYHRQFLSV